MSDGFVKVDFGQVAALAEQITSQSNKIESELDQLRQQISQLDQIWEGAASAGYQQTKAQWFQAADDLRTTLARIGAAVHAASDSYSSTEASNAKLWG